MGKNIYFIKIYSINIDKIFEIYQSRLICHQINLCYYVYVYKYISLITFLIHNSAFSFLKTTYY